MEENNELHFAVDLPPHSPNRRGSYEEWINIQFFHTRQEAIDWAKKHLNADDEGNINIISSM